MKAKNILSLWNEDEDNPTTGVLYALQHQSNDLSHHSLPVCQENEPIPSQAHSENPENAA